MSFRVLSLVAAAWALALLLSTSAWANGTPLKYNLRFLEDVSNFGPRDAVGQLEVVLVEGDVTLTAVGLPRLVNDRYELWLMNPSLGQQVSAGKFNASPEGRVEFKTVADRLGQTEFELVEVTVEPEPDPNPNEPDGRVSIAGRLRPPDLPVRTGGDATPAPTGTPHPGPEQVRALPRTGQAAPGQPGIGLALIVALGVLVGGWARRVTSDE